MTKKQLTQKLNRALAVVLTIAALAAGQAAWAMSSFTVSCPNSDNTFRITRTGNTAVAETIDWRVVSLSAIAGVHFTGYQGNYSGQVTFAPGDPYVDVTISENTPSDNAYKYQNGTERKYRFEVLDKDGSILATKDRTMTTGTSVPSSGLFNEKEITIYTNELQYNDAGYDKNTNNPHYINSSSYYNLSGIAPAAYYTLIGAQLRSTLSLEAREENNGYQYVQILINNISTCDNRSDCSNGDPGNINLSRYMAGFDHEPSKANTNYATYTFPVTSQPNNCSEVSNAWSNGVTNKLYTQKFNTNCRATDGRLILPLDFEKFVVRFNASGGGSDHDEWLAKNVKAHIQAVDATRPTVLGNYTVSGGRHQKGNTIYVSVAFSEIVTVTGTPTLSSNWGTLSYVAGSGSNVLTFMGTIDPSDNNAFGVSGYTLNGGTIKDLAGNSFSGSISHSFGTTLDEDYAWTTSDFNQLETNTYEIYTTLDMRHLALMVNSGNNDCSGLTFKQTHDITYTHTTNWNNSSSQEDNYTAIGTVDHGFQGTFDGQDHTISGIRIYRGDYTSADDYQGLFGYISGGTVRGVNLADARITGFKYVGGIAGKIYSCTVKDCTVAADVCIHAVHGDSDYHGGIVGNSQGTVQRCLSRARLTVTDASDCGYYGAIVGYNNNHAVKDCIAIGASVPSVSNAGAIIGYGNNISNGVYDVQRNYYRDCTVAGVENATGVGVGYDKNTKSPHDVTANQGAQALYSLTLSSGVTQVRTASATLPGTGNKTYTTGADIDGTPYAFDGAALTFSYTGEAVTTMGYAVLFYKDGTPFEGNSYKMTTSDVSITASATDLWGIADNADGSADHPYRIGTRTALDLLASYVNSGISEFDSKHFLQTENLTYDEIKTYINNVPTVTSNYTAIGYYNDDNDHKAFKGHYNGGGRTITGIQIIKTGHANSDSYLGLFGYIDGGTIENVVLAQGQIKGNRNIGSIAGYLQNGTIQNCHIGSNVSIVIGNASNAAYQGGVVGQMSSGSCVQGCFCGANINRSDQISTANWYYGGIAGYSLGTIQNNIYTGSFYNYKLDSFGGAIAGDHSGGTLANNYYTSKDVPGGINYTDQDGARRARTVTLGENIALLGDETAYSLSGLTAIGTGNYALRYNDGNTTTIYSGEGQTLTLSYTGEEVPVGYQLTYSATAGTIDGNTLTMPADDVTVSAAIDAIPWSGSGSKDDPYIIMYRSQLDLLAERINAGGGNDYYHKYIKLGADIVYDGTENNYTPIGNNSGTYSFIGTFDGDGHTVSGININRGNDYQGLFGYVDGGTVKNVTLANSTITANDRVGGIAGYNHGTVQNCRVESTVTINAYADNTINHGGIVGYCEYGTVDGCISSATISPNGKNKCYNFAAIAGYNNSGTIRNCLAIGATASSKSDRGAIVGLNNYGTLTNNYYYNCTVGGATTNVGTNNGDVSDNDGAVQASSVLSESETVPSSLSDKVVFRREFTGGKASTVIFPFAHEKGTEGTYYTFGGVAYDGTEGKWKATMNEYSGATLMANTPYLFVPAGSEAHTPVLFHGTADYSTAGSTAVTDWAFKGIYAQKTWAAGDVGRDYGFAATSGKAVDGVTDVNAGDFVKLAEGAWIRPMRAYLTYTGTGNPWASTNAPAHRAATKEMPNRISVILVSANGETTEIKEVIGVSGVIEVNDNSWYTLDGRKLDKQPTTKGLYIYKGKKVIK